MNTSSVQASLPSPQPEGDPHSKDGSSLELLKEWRYAKSHPLEAIMRIPSHGVRTRSPFQNIYNFHAFLFQLEPKYFLEAESNESWMMAMQEELNQFKRNQVWELVPRPTHQSIIRTKWVYRNKLDEHGTIGQNKARLVAKG